MTEPEAIPTQEQPTLTCPRCGVEQEDFDGFGFMACEACHYCTHPSRDGNSLGYMICGICGDAEPPAEGQRGSVSYERQDGGTFTATFAEGKGDEALWAEVKQILLDWDGIKGDIPPNAHTELNTAIVALVKRHEQEALFAEAQKHASEHAPQTQDEIDAVDAHYRPILEALIHKFECKLPGAMCDECDAAFRVYEASR